MTTDDVTPLAAEQPNASEAKWRQRLAVLVEWLTRRQALALARSESRQSETALRALVHARNALRAGDRLLDPPDGSPRQYQLAVALFRESAQFFLAAGCPESDAGPGLTEQIAKLSDAEDAALAAWLTAHPVPACLLEAPTAFAAKPVEQRVAQAEAAQRWLRELALSLDSGLSRVTRLEQARALRLGLSALLLVGLIGSIGVAVAAAVRGPDLAAGKPWRTSSTHEVCHPEKRECGGVATSIFFHTRDEDNPWYEVDLLSPRRIHRVELVNRRDESQERAVPLVVEASLDAQRYFQVAQRKEVFDVHNAEFPPVQARYVRVTVMKRTALHLERVSVR